MTDKEREDCENLLVDILESSGLLVITKSESSPWSINKTLVRELRKQGYEEERGYLAEDVEGWFFLDTMPLVF